MSMYSCGLSPAVGAFIALSCATVGTFANIHASSLKLGVRCRRRSLTSAQHFAICDALMGDRDKPWCNHYVAPADDCEMAELLVRRGLLKFMHEFAGFRRYRVTEAGAAAVGLWLPYD
jgi:hypothetical protein